MNWTQTSHNQLLGSIVVFNVLDAIATLSWVQMGLATEANPLMHELISVHPVLFVFLKVMLVSLGVELLSRYHERSAAVWAAHALFLTYTLIVCYHILGGLLSA